MHFLFSLVAFLPFAHAADCPNFSGTYSDRDLFREQISQDSCDALTWTNSVHPKNPNPPGPPDSEPSTSTWTIDCKKHASMFQMESSCWNKDVLENWTYSKSHSGTWVPFSIRRVYFDSTGSLHDDAYLVDGSGEHRYLSGIYTRE